VRASFAPRCPCGRELSQPAGGGRRVTCSDACRRARDFATRRARRREVWIQKLENDLRERRCTKRDALQQMRALRGEIENFRAQAGRDVELERWEPDEVTEARA
jgi:hypothetical protein